MKIAVTITALVALIAIAVSSIYTAIEVRKLRSAVGGLRTAIMFSGPSSSELDDIKRGVDEIQQLVEQTYEAADEARSYAQEAAYR